MANIDTSNMELNPYVPQTKPAKQEFLVIIPCRIVKDTAEVMQPIAQNIYASVFNYTNQDNINSSIAYDYIYFNANNYFLIPLKLSGLPSYDIAFTAEENNLQIGGDNFSNFPIEPIEGPWYILYYVPIDAINSDYFTPTGIYFTQDNFPMPDLSAWEPEITPVPQNTIVNAEDDFTSYIYTENGWEVFANNTPNITDSETQLFIRGLVYGEDVESHEDEGGGTIIEGGGDIE